MFDIQNTTGEIRTRVELDFETQPVHYVVVTAVDNGEKEKKSSTATVTVYVQDTADEVGGSVRQCCHYAKQKYSWFRN